MEGELISVLHVSVTYRIIKFKRCRKTRILPWQRFRAAILTEPIPETGTIQRNPDVFHVNTWWCILLQTRKMDLLSKKLIVILSVCNFFAGKLYSDYIPVPCLHLCW